MATYQEVPADPLEAYRLEKDAQIETIISTVPHHGDQLDAIAKVRGWYGVDFEANAVIREYMSSQLSLEQAVLRLAAPIDQLYTSGNNGRAFYEAELVARTQRPLYSAQEAEELWGVEQDFDPSVDEHLHPDTETLLGRLWNAVAHAARKNPWQDQAAHQKLMELIKALKSRPDPPRPANITIAMTRDWIYSSGTIWSSLSLMGPSFRECWNDAPGMGAGFSIREIEAHANINAFCARMSVSKLGNYWNYGIWTIREALETRHDQSLVYTHRGSEEMWLDAWLPSAAVWIHVSGREIFQFICETDDDQVTYYPVKQSVPTLPWQGQDAWTRARWRFWRERFGLMTTWDGLSDESRRLSKEACRLMQYIDSVIADGGGDDDNDAERR